MALAALLYQMAYKQIVAHAIFVSLFYLSDLFEYFHVGLNTNFTHTYQTKLVVSSLCTSNREKYNKVNAIFMFFSPSRSTTWQLFHIYPT